MDAKQHITIIDDDSMTLELTRSVLEELDYSTSTYRGADKFLEQLPEQTPALIILDIYMPNLTGIELTEQLRANASYKHVPILITTSSAEDIERAFNAGANDFIEKPFDARKHLPRIKFHIKAAQNALALQQNAIQLQDANEQLNEWSKTLEFKVDKRTKELSQANYALREEVNERRFLEDRLRYIATHDFLTRLYNRPKLEQHIDQNLSVPINKNNKRPFLLYIDLDQFKVVNEHFGHFAGDELLRQIAELLISFSEDNTIVSRLGGDEFALVFNESSVESAKRKSESIAHRIKSHEFIWQEQAFIFSLSGALLDFADSWLSSSQMLSTADTLIFELKLKGGNNIKLYNPSESGIDDSKFELQWIPQINHAIKNDQFELHFQKIAHASANIKPKAEVLVRMQDKDKGRLIYPSHFIDVAEKFHLINKVDFWVLENTCKYLAEQQSPFERLSVNLSGETITHRDHLKNVIACIKNYGLDGSQLCLEVTESSALHDLRSTQNFIDLIKSETQCQVALDDFGTGQASYAYLKTVSFDVLKIDGIFIRSICDEIVDQKLVGSLVEVAHLLNMTVVAEYVENRAIAEKLSALNVDWLQGYYIHKPELLV